MPKESSSSSIDIKVETLGLREEQSSFTWYRSKGRDDSDEREKLQKELYRLKQKHCGKKKRRPIDGAKM